MCVSSELHDQSFLSYIRLYESGNAELRKEIFVSFDQVKPAFDHYFFGETIESCDDLETHFAVAENVSNWTTSCRLIEKAIHKKVIEFFLNHDHKEVKEFVKKRTLVTPFIPRLIIIVSWGARLSKK